MKDYKLSLENIGTDVYTLMSRGHHDPELFKEEIKKEYPTWFRHLGKVKHIYFKNVYGRYIESTAETKGSFPATYISEGTRED